MGVRYRACGAIDIVGTVAALIDLSIEHFSGWTIQRGTNEHAEPGEKRECDDVSRRSEVGAWFMNE